MNKKQERLVVYMTKELRQWLLQKADSLGLPESTYARTILFKEMKQEQPKQD